MKKTLNIAGKPLTVEYGFYKAGAVVLTATSTRENSATPYDMHIDGAITRVQRTGTRKVQRGIKGTISIDFEYQGRSYKSEKKLAEAILVGNK